MVKKGYMLCVKDCPEREKSMCKGPRTGTEGLLRFPVNSEDKRKLRQWAGSKPCSRVEKFS